MVLTAAQTTAFFEAADQIGIPHATVVQLQVEGMTSLPDLADFDKDTFVSMQQCAEHLEYQLPNEHTRVGYLLDGIQCSDAGLQAAMASVRTDDGTMGMRNTFESAAAYLLPYNPVAKKCCNASKRDAGQISSVEVNTDDTKVSSMMSNKKKQSIGSTGVHLDTI